MRNVTWCWSYRAALLGILCSTRGDDPINLRFQLLEVFLAEQVVLSHEHGPRSAGDMRDGLSQSILDLSTDVAAATTAERLDKERGCPPG